MALISKITNVFATSNVIADKLTSVAKGVLCIPSILGNLPSIAGAVGKNILNNLLTGGSGIFDALSGMVTSIVDDAINQITGVVTDALSKVLQIQATIFGTISLIRDFYQGIKDRVSDIKNFVSSSENCTFAAAELLNCVTSSILSDVTKQAAKNIKSGSLDIGNFTRGITNKLSSSTGTLANYGNKIGKSVDKANKQLEVIAQL